MKTPTAGPDLWAEWQQHKSKRTGTAELAHKYGVSHEEMAQLLRESLAMLKQKEAEEQ